MSADDLRRAAARVRKILSNLRLLTDVEREAFGSAPSAPEIIILTLLVALALLACGAFLLAVR